MDNERDKQIRQFIQHACAQAPTVRMIFDRADLTPGDIQSLADLDRIPVTSKDRLIQLQQEQPPFGGFLATPLDSLEHIFFSPGPLYEPHGGDSPVMDSIGEILSIAGFESGEIVLNTFGYHLIPTGLAVDQKLRERGAIVVPAGVGNADLQIKMIHELAISGYVGTPSWLMSLIQKVEESGLDFRQSFHLKKALVSAEPLPPSLRQAFVEKYGLRITNAYGTAELGFLAYNTEEGMAMRLLETGIIQICNPETGYSVAPGEVGEVVVTSFNETYPLIRLGTGDMAMNIDPAPGQSRQADRSIILVGRVGEAVKVRGMFIHPNQLRFAAGQTPDVARLQAVVSRSENRDDLVLKVVTTGEASDREKIKQTLSEAVRSVCRVKADQIDFCSASDLDENAPLIIDERRWE